jgi:anti-sigma factor RsiW
MKDDPMIPDPTHIADDQLLLHVDGELSFREGARVCAHLESCGLCRDRLAAMVEVLSESTSSCREHQPGMQSFGPRALLRARLAEESRRTPGHSWWSPRLLRSLAYAAVLALMVSAGQQMYHRVGLAQVEQQAAGLPVLPNPGFTPGSTRPVTLAEVCSLDRDDVVREVPAPLQQKVFQEYGIKDQPAKDFEVDYLITPGLGGSDDVRNLWPEPHANATWNSYVKDQLETRMHQMVCAHELSLEEAQHEIASDWIAAYKKHFHTDQPLAGAVNSARSIGSYARFASRRKQLSA